MAAADLLARLRDEPERAALLLDVDGTLAPIVERPEDALVPEETRAELEPEAERWAAAVHEFASGVAWPPEDKGLTVAFHYRGALDEEAARAELEEVAVRARAAGLHTRFGRKVLELLPPVEANKGTAIRRLLADRQLRRALYAGDDTTDLDAFRALDGLDVAVRVAVASAEGKEVWSINTEQPMHAIRLPNKNTLVATVGNGYKVIEYDP